MVEEYEKNIPDDDGWYDKPNNVVGVLVEPISGKPAVETDEKKK